MNLPKITTAQILLQVFEKYQIREIVISPGSRNAPLTLGFANQSYFRCYSIVDERCAAFFALGIAQQKKEPVVLVCTSGSALLNYYPAIAEAFYSEIPLIVLSADRPSHKIDIGDGQTIRQQNVFANHILKSVQLLDEDTVDNDVAIQDAIYTAKVGKGPVHINVPFEEPLYELVSDYSRIPHWVSFSEATPTTTLLPKVVEAWNQSTKKLLLIGNQPKNEQLEKLLEEFSNDASVLVLSEKNSNVHAPHIIDEIDVLISDFSKTDKHQFQPDILISLGGMLVSKRIKALLRSHPPKYHYHVDATKANDTFGVLTGHVNISALDGLKQLTFQSNKEGYATYFLENWHRKKEKAKAFAQQAPFSDYKVFDFICQYLPDNLHLQVSNSASIRYLQLFKTKPNWEIFCNRGTSGIDGSTSTAVGAALFHEKPTVLITGDLSFFYDSNGLWNQYIPNDFKIILINNGGGGIFRILPGHQDQPVFHQFFETQHHLNAQHLAAMYGFAYVGIEDEISLKKQWNHFISTNAKTILEINTSKVQNENILKDFFKYIQTEMD
ncbi:MAG: 2-succinyl-5-enolpyruvyl-6-hydroxy-3-cyclohexene-1-carboxylic-acid synthase [Flavobacteriales bacterium]|nr:2-succinyl-5-enolpyruvyl-6-hydroxy-3-cyclohexene-1-carboxylic-acid synthase [Flavobacteriales bacterium]